MMQRMSRDLRDIILGQNRQVPRYTSYPSAPHFAPLEDDALYTRWLHALPQGEEISLYIHIPFCPKMCWYCGCNTKISKRYDPIAEYVAFLIKEIEILRNTLGERHSVSQIHFGGGSPSALNAQDFEGIMMALRDAFAVKDGAEISIEVDPRNINELQIAAYAKHGVSRVSLGVQDFDERVLKAVNRVQPFHLSYEAVRLMREYGIAQVNVDMLYGLPHQSVETMAHSIEKALLLKPDRFAFFGYAHVPWMKKHMRLIEEGALPDKALRYDLFETGAALLEKAGYVAIGIDHFARAEDTLSIAMKEGTMRRNFQGYTSDPCATLIGLGASSIGKFAEGYVQNSPDMPGYKKRIEAGRLSVRRFVEIDADDRLRANVIEQLMCFFSVDLSALCADHNVDDNYFVMEIKALRPYQMMGVLEIQNQVITIAPQARQMARIVGAVFDRYFQEKASEARHSQAV